MFLIILVQVILGVMTFMYVGTASLGGSSGGFWIFIPSIIGVISIFGSTDKENYRPWFWISMLTVPAWFLIAYFVQ